MTGFGRGEVSLPNKKIIAEIRTLNSKQLDLNVKLPSAYRQAEHEVRNIISKGVVRGKVDLFITTESTATQSTKSTINSEVFGAYYKQLENACIEQGILLNDNTIASLVQSTLRMPDVMSSSEETTSEQEIEALVSAVELAITHLNEFRGQEGAILISDILSRIDNIERHMHDVTPYESPRAEVVKSRILENLAKLEAEVDQNRLAQEMIYYLEKFDITEEKVRLANHCNYFREVVKAEESVGRKLGFISQEIGREINTMGSKANDANIQVLVIKMKDELEKIKEQTLNIL